MELQAARQIIDTLAQGIHPVTGEVMPEDSPYNAPPVIRGPVRRVAGAGDQAARALGLRAPMLAKPWAGRGRDEKLSQSYAAGRYAERLANELGRTPFAVEARLVKLGKLAADAGGCASSPPRREALRLQSTLPSRRYSMSAFCTCMRFSASSQTTDCGPSITSAFDLFAAVRRQAMHEERIGLGHAHHVRVDAPVGKGRRRASFSAS
jgi:hypothetical protein